MSRKFNIGRQNDLLLNEKMHELYSHLEFITYKDGDGNTITMPRQTKQTEIPKGALWLQHPMGTDTHKLRVLTDPYATDMEAKWPCLFEGYYHPADLTAMPTNPVHGQIWIDDKNMLRIFNSNGVEGKWEDVCTKIVPETKYDIFNGMDFQLIDPLLPIEYDSGEKLNLYTVPYESFGKYFTSENHEGEFIYCHPGVQQPGMPNYNTHQTENVISVDSESEDFAAKAWVHVNPYNLNGVTKRLIKINKPKTYYKKYNAVQTYNDRVEEELDTLLKVVSDDVILSEFDPDTMIKLNFANKHKYNQSKDFIVGDFVQPVVITDQNTGFIAIPAGKTEYYAFRSNQNNRFDEYDNKVGRLLKRYALKEGVVDTTLNENNNLTEEDINKILDYRNDYEIRNGGIVLDKNIIEEYDYIYAITYDFKVNHTVDGELIRITRTSLEGPDQIYIGQCSGEPVVFMDGLYLEQESGSIYTYDNENIVFTGNDVLDNMQILVVSFPYVNVYTDAQGIEYRREYLISESCLKERYDICDSTDKGAIRVVKDPINNEGIKYSDVIAHTPDLRTKIDDSGSFYVKQTDIKDAVIQGEVGDSLFDKENFPNPLIFYNGLAGYTYAAFINENKKDRADVSIDYETRHITLHDFGPIVDSNGMSTIFAVSLGKNNSIYHGVLIDGVLYDENIKADMDYLVIVDGLVMSPYNDDVTVEDGKITITDATVALDSECTYIELTDPNDDSILDDTDAVMCIYDDMFAPYSIPITNPKALNKSNAYDDCDSAIVMCGPGVLVDREALQKDFNPDEKFVGGQIVKKRLKTVNKDEIYEWRMYTYTNEYIILDPIEDAVTISDCENIVTYYMNSGTVLLNPVNIDDQPVTVYAYSYVDHIDEKLLRGQRLIPIVAPNHSDNTAGQHIYKTNRTHLYDVGTGALSTYINGVMVHHVEEETNDKKGDVFFIKEQLSSPFIPFINRYREENSSNRLAGQDMYDVLMAINDDDTIEDEIEVVTNGYKTRYMIEYFFNSEHQLSQAKALKNYILNDMKNNNFMYIIENVEADERVSTRRQWNADRNDNGNLPNSYTTTMRLTPGILNVYVNGVLLDRDDYAIFDNNKVMIGFDLVGGQEILPKNKQDYKYPYRVSTDEGFKYIECEGNDEVLIEVRDDLALKKRSYKIKDVSYETYSFDIIDYDYPASLSTTKDVIKIYINGVLYDGDYTNINGVITLLDCDLEEDPLYKYLRMFPAAMEEYKKEYGEYILHEDIITFEWR